MGAEHARITLLVLHRDGALRRHDRECGGRAYAASCRPSAPITTNYEAAVRGDPDAQASLAVFHANEAGGPQSNAYALQWFIRAAGQGHAQAQLMLSEIFAAGKGVPKNNLAAYKWASVAAASAREPQTTENAVAMLKLLAPQMSQAQIVEARSLAAGWKPKPEVLQANNDQPTENRGSRPATPVSVPTSSSTQSRARETRAAAELAEHVTTRVRSWQRYLRASVIWLATR